MLRNNLRGDLAKYRQAASSQFHNAVGDESQQFAQALDLNDRTLTVSVAPVVSTVGGTAIIFGSNLYPDETQNTANNMVVTVAESSHGAAKRYSQGSPWRIRGLLYEVSNVLQFSNTIKIINQSVNGVNYRTPMAQIATLLQIPDFQTVITGDDRIEILFGAGYTGTLTFTIKDKLEIAQALSSRTPIKSS
jgi:hypothetical protein